MKGRGSFLFREKKAFTLVELLVVISIIVILAAISAPAILGPTASARMNQNLLTLSGMLENARQYAVADNTYVWVAFAPITDSSTGKMTLYVALLASADGTDPGSPNWNTYPYHAVPSSQIALISKVTGLSQFAFSTMSIKNFDGEISSLPSTAIAANALAELGSASQPDSGFFTIQIPGNLNANGQLTFTYAVEFTPTGQARNAASPIDLVELDLQPQKGAQLDASNLAAIRINGLTGESVIYRP